MIVPGAVPYLDALTGDALSRADRLAVGLDTAPRLINAVCEAGLVAWVSHDLGTLAAIKAEDPDRASFYQLSRASLHPEAGRHDTAIVVLTDAGRPVASGSVRIRWIEGTLREALESRALLYADPRQAPDGEAVICRAAKAGEIRSCDVAVAGGLWVARQHTSADSRVNRLLVRLLTLIATANYRWSWCISVSHPPLMRRAFPVYGADGVEAGVIVTVDGVPIETVLIHATRMRFVENLRLPAFADPAADLGQPAPADVDRAAATRRALAEMVAGGTA